MHLVQMESIISPYLIQKVIAKLNNEDWFQTQLTHTIFHVTTSEELKHRIYVEEHTLKLRPFDIKNMRKNNISFVIGKRRTGKTTLIKKLLSEAECFGGNPSLLFSEMEKLNPEYTNLIPNEFIHDVINDTILEETLKKVWKRQVALNQYINELHVASAQDPAEKRKNIVGEVSLIFEDSVILDGRSFFRKDIVKKFFMNNRHARTNLLLAMQHLPSIPPALRYNTDYIFYNYNTFTSISDRKKLYENLKNSGFLGNLEHYFTNFQNFKTFSNTLEALAKENRYGFLVIDGVYKKNALFYI